MRFRVCVPLVAFLSIIQLASCSTKNNQIPFAAQEEKENQSIYLTGLAACSQNTLRDPENPEHGITSLDSLAVEVDGGKVSFTHHGASFNCCMDSVRLSLDRKDNLFKVTETEHTPYLCRCICDYTVFGEIDEVLPAGDYLLEIHRDTDPDQVLCYARFSVH